MELQKAAEYRRGGVVGMPFELCSDLKDSPLFFLVEALAAHTGGHKSRRDSPYDHCSAGTQAPSQGNRCLNPKFYLGNRASKEPRGMAESLQKQIVRTGVALFAA